MEHLTEITKFNSLTEMISVLPDDTSCREYLENLIWKNIPVCSQCRSTNSYRLTTKGNFKGQYKCKDCRKRYNVQDNTMFEGTHIGLRKWFIAIYVFSLHKKGISSYQLASDLAVTQKTAWYMLGRIRLAFKPAPLRAKLTGTFQCDETFVGGKEKNKHKSRYAQKEKEYMQELGNYDMSKTPVAGLRDESGNVIVKVVPDTTTASLKGFINENVVEGSTIVTDEYSGYNSLYKTYTHETVNHKAGMYAYNGFHTNGIENFWSQLKRGIYGIYHQVSPKHLHRYCDEFSYRHNERKISDDYRFTLSLARVTGRLTYKQLIAKDANQEA